MPKCGQKKRPAGVLGKERLIDERDEEDTEMKLWRPIQAGRASVR
jgi:hypothetical protein